MEIGKKKKKKKKKKTTKKKNRETMILKCFKFDVPLKMLSFCINLTYEQNKCYAQLSCE